MGKSKLKLITFDAVNTLIKCSSSPAKHYADIAKKFGLCVNEQDIKDVYESSWNKMKHHYPNYGIQFNMKSEEWWKTFITDVFCNAGYSKEIRSSRSLVENISKNIYKKFETKECWMASSGVQETLSDFKNAGFKLAVVSNFDERLPVVLNALNLHKYFDLLVTSVCAQAEKPDPLIFQYALSQAGVKADESIHIGDSLGEDYLPAKNLGICSYLFVENGMGTGDSMTTLVNEKYLVSSFPSFKNLICELYL